jgi:acyl-CoA synthetase (AMP-forming)/AMP-acid ligase II
VGFVDDLGRFGTRTALVLPAPAGTPAEGARVVTYHDLATRVAAVADRLGPTRRLVLVEPTPTLEGVVTYLGALAGGHVVLLCPVGAATAHERLVAGYDPDVVVHRSGQGTDRTWVLRERRPGTAHTLHPDLALLLGTSGSAGSPKLVRLSAENLTANAESVALSLGITEADRAVTTLPLSYCYGLSVLHSHLTRGASVVLSEHSVIDEGFWRTVEDLGVTNLAGVPHTFDLLDRAGFSDRSCPALRLVTQAGGRMAPERVAAVAGLGARRGWDLVVMYGQTEATARIACMPAGLAVHRPDAVGRPVPGGRIRILPHSPADAGTPDDGNGVEAAPGEIGVEAAPGEIGEIVFEGPHVMLGYAHGPGDLALGRTVTRLRTGDLGRIGPDGLLEVTGRLSAVIKVFGVRIDLERAEASLADLGLTGLAAGRDDRLDIAVECCAHPAMVRSVLAAEFSLPPSTVRVVAVGQLPRTPNGKPDRTAVTALVEAGTRCAASCAGPPPGHPDHPNHPDDVACPAAADRTGAGGPAARSTDPTSALVALYAELLDRPDADATSTFTSLGGDSLSYVELSVRLEAELGTLPDGWATTPIAGLATRARPQRTPWARVETAVLLRCLAIVAVVGTHANLFTLRGGAHLLLAVAGFNAARFTFPAAPTRERLRDHLNRTGRTLGRIVVPTVCYVGVLAALGLYPWATALLVNGPLGPDRWEVAWHFWFVEALVWIVAATGLLLCVPAVRRVRATRPFGVALALVAVGLLPRFDLVHLSTGPERGTAQNVFWLFALGWAVAETRTNRQRFVVSAVAVPAVAGYFDVPARNAVVLAGILALTWMPAVRLPRLVTPAVGVVASSSLHTYLTQWQVFPLLRDVPVLALVGSLAVGAAAWALAERVRRTSSRRFRLPTHRTGVSAPTRNVPADLAPTRSAPADLAPAAVDLRVPAHPGRDAVPVAGPVPRRTP